MTTQIQEYSQTEAALKALAEQYAGATFDVDTTDGMKAAKAARADVRGYRTSLEAMRKKIKGPALERCRLIDAEAKRITEALRELEDPIDAQIKEHEAKKEAERQAKIEAEQKRVESIQERIAEIRGAVAAVNCMGAPASAKVSEFITEVENIVVDESFDEFFEAARDAKIATLAALTDLHKAAVEREAEEERIKAERAELEKLRKEQAERAAKERAEREAKEAEERKAREEAERQERERLEAQRKEQEAEQKRIDDERKALEAEKERERKAKEKAEREAAERKAAAEEAARKAKFPGIDAITDALADYFDVPAEVALKWIDEIRTKEAA